MPKLGWSHGLVYFHHSDQRQRWEQRQWLRELTCTLSGYLAGARARDQEFYVVQGRATETNPRPTHHHSSLLAHHFQEYVDGPRQEAVPGCCDRQSFGQGDDVRIADGSGQLDGALQNVHTAAKVATALAETDGEGVHREDGYLGGRWGEVAPHLHVVWRESSVGGGVREHVSRFGIRHQLRIVLSSRTLECFNCSRLYLSLGGRTLVQNFEGRSDVPLCVRCRREGLQGNDRWPQLLVADASSGRDLQCMEDPEELAGTLFERSDRDKAIERAQVLRERRTLVWQGPRQAYVAELQALLEVCCPRDMSSFERWLFSENYVFYIHSPFWRQYAATCFSQWKTGILKMSVNECIAHWFSKGDSPEYMTIQESTHWILKILANSNIDHVQFVLDAHALLDRLLPKKNCLILQGENNSGKTLIANSLAHLMISVGEVQCLDMSRNQFWGQSMYMTRVVLANEITVTDQTAETLKNLCEGQPVMIPIKYQHDYRMERTPIIITTNTPVFSFTINRVQHERSLAVRSFHYMFRSMSSADWTGCTLPLNPLVWNGLFKTYCDME